MYPNLKLQLWRAGLKQNQAAKLMGVDESAFSRIVNGYKSPSSTFRRGIAALLRRDEAWLFEYHDVVPSPSTTGEGATDH